MYNASYNIAGTPIRYVPLWLRADNINAICSFIFQFKIDYAIRQLTPYPIPESEIEFQWEQLSGTPPLEFSDWNAAQPIVTVNPDIKDDLLFRVYLDKGKKTELWADLWVYRTPTEFNHSRYSDFGMKQVLPVRANNYLAKPNIKISSLIPALNQDFVSVDSLGNVRENFSTDQITNYFLKFSVPPIYEQLGHEVESVEIYNPATGMLVEFNTYSEVTEVYLPLDLRQFYYILKVSMYKNHPKIPTKVIEVYDNKIHSTLYNELFVINAKRTFNSDLLAAPKFDLQNTTHILTKEWVKQYPVQRVFDAGTDAYNIANEFLSGDFKANIAKTVMEGVQLHNQETINNELNAINLNKPIERVGTIIRYSGITIGG